MIGLRVASETLRSFTKLLDDSRRFFKDVSDRDQAMQRVKQHMVDRWAVNFTGEGEIYGKWLALNNTWTIPERIEKGHGAGPMLVRTGALFTHFVNQNDAGEVTNEAVYWQFKNKGSYGQPGGWTVRHHFGYKNPLPRRRPIPARILWDVNDEDQDHIEELIDDFVDILILRHME